jgi:SAM-dependent methyltransferase
LKDLDKQVITDFGSEWKPFNQSYLFKNGLKDSFMEYFLFFPLDQIDNTKEVFDMGCGSGRWARFMANKCKILNCIEPSQAIEVAKENVKSFSNINFFNQTADICTLSNNTQNFGYCLGVLHHTTRTIQGLQRCYDILKPNSPFLLYMYCKLTVSRPKIRTG